MGRNKDMVHLDITMNKEAPDEIDIAIMTMLNRHPIPTQRDIGMAVQRSHVTVRQRIQWLLEMEYLKAPEVKGAPRALTLTDEAYRLLFPAKYGKPEHPPARVRRIREEKARKESARNKDTQ
jgi:DNA-binding Lrp family transcriptional regulator